MVTTTDIWQWLEEVSDPEVPVLSVVDLGVVRSVNLKSENEVAIVITPTYSGCPAMQYIERGIREMLENKGFELITISTSLSPAWTTDWITEKGRQNLQAYGIAPPQNEVDKGVLFADPVVVPCPKCHSSNTRMISQFGSTACKAHYNCNACLEPFDYFKCLK